MSCLPQVGLKDELGEQHLQKYLHQMIYNENILHFYLC